MIHSNTSSLLTFQKRKSAEIIANPSYFYHGRGDEKTSAETSFSWLSFSTVLRTTKWQAGQLSKCKSEVFNEK